MVFCGAGAGAGARQGDLSGQGAALRGAWSLQRHPSHRPHGRAQGGYRRLKIGLLERGLDPLDVFQWNPKRPPYPGLLAFQEQDAAIFFGRAEEILKALETLDALRRQGREAARFALLLGASGSGKSSLARAGVIPRLK